MSRKFYAHSVKGEDPSRWQGLMEHLLGVAKLAAENAEPLGLGEIAYLAGLLHDLGKFDPDFQARLSGSQQAVDHSTAGAWAVRQLAGISRDMAELIAYAIAGHHAGLPDASGAPGTLADRVEAFNPARLDAGWREALALPTQIKLPSNFKRPAEPERRGFRFAMLGRMIFSCLVDADFRNTEAFYAEVEGRETDRTWLPLRDILPELVTRFDAHMAGKAGQPGPINELRAEILATVRARAALEPGFFTLAVPTGGGKTLASLGFALDHAARHGHRRIICAIPFTSIIDQTAAALREALERPGEEFVLEHHSAIETATGPGTASADPVSDKRRRAMEDWTAPLVVTTNVQLFESLFASRTSRARKLHNIARSVIILDEAQTLPRKLLIPAIWALRELVEVYGCSVVLCTATQPALEKSRFPAPRPGTWIRIGLDLAGRELAPDPARLAGRLKRVTLRHGGVMTDDALLADLAARSSGLVIVNSRPHALELFRAGRQAGLEGMMHLTTRQCAAHRRRILADVRERLADGRPCRLIATSLIEAGVDVDFPAVWRAESGLDQIIQAAGRCNREGKRLPEESLVTVFEPAERKPHDDIKMMAEAMNRVRAKHPDLSSLEAIEAYFHEIYWAKGDEGLDRGADGTTITGRFRHEHMYGPSIDYRTTAAAFRMIDETMEPVIIPLGDAAKMLVDKLSYPQIPTGSLARGLQPYIVQVPPRDRARLIENGLVRFHAPELRGDQFAVLTSMSHYTDEVGLEWERADELGGFIV
jgi:CRISPR-associated endonuclease/helicase Cas3